MRYFNFYAEDQEGINGTDYHVEISELEDGVILVEESHCGRTRGSIWSTPQSYYDDHFWLTVQNMIKYFGGMENISKDRIGQVENW